MWLLNDSFVKKTLKNLYFRPAKDELVTKPCTKEPHAAALWIPVLQSVAVDIYVDEQLHVAR